MKMLCSIATANEMHVRIMPERGTTDAVFMLRRLLEEYHVKGKKIM